MRTTARKVFESLVARLHVVIHLTAPLDEGREKVLNTASPLVAAYYLAYTHSS